MSRILVVDDEPHIADLVATVARYEGWQAVTAGTGQAALSRAAEFGPDIVVLDLMLPDLDGFTVLDRLRGGGNAVPVVFLTAKDATADRVAGLTRGGDDYLVKPFSVEELMARLRAVLRRAAAPVENAVISVGGLEIDPVGFTVRRDGVELPVTATEFRLLVELARRPGQVFTRELLLQRVWDYEYLGESHLVDVAVQRLRAKVEADPAHPVLIKTVRGVGYRLERAKP